MDDSRRRVPHSVRAPSLRRGRLEERLVDLGQFSPIRPSHIEPLGERLVAGTRGIQRARADEDDGCLRVSEADLRPAEWQCEAFAGAVGGPAGFGDRAAVQPLERVRAEELQVLLALAHAVKTTRGGR